MGTFPGSVLAGLSAWLCEVGSGFCGDVAGSGGRTGSSGPAEELHGGAVELLMKLQEEGRDVNVEEWVSL